MNDQPLLRAINSSYTAKLLEWHGMICEPVGALIKVKGFDQYNALLDINQIFSSFPFGDIIDRTQTVRGPLNFHVQRAWQTPTSCCTLDEFMNQRAQEILSLNSTIGIFWSGGIDSTAMTAALLQTAHHQDQIEIFYSPHSVYENREFFDFVTKKFDRIRTIDISGDYYLNTHFDGRYVTGHGCDELTASLDQEFYDRTGPDQLLGPWQDYFAACCKDQDLIELAEHWFAQAGRPIANLLQARWWFYCAAKSQVHELFSNMMFLNQQSYRHDLAVGFYNVKEFEHYMFFNIDDVINFEQGWSGYKWFLKQYIYKFDKNQNRLMEANKKHSIQILRYIQKKIRLLDCRWILKLADDSVIRTPNLPFLSRKEFEAIYGKSLDYLFNQPD